MMLSANTGDSYVFYVQNSGKDRTSLVLGEISALLLASIERLLRRGQFGAESMTLSLPRQIVSIPLDVLIHSVFL
jgi:hypothetical protein